jgi:hypothetical protein
LLCSSAGSRFEFLLLKPVSPFDNLFEQQSHYQHIFEEQHLQPERVRCAEERTLKMTAAIIEN